MALVPLRIDRTSKPPLGTPLRSDGHWGVQGLVGGWALNEGTGKTAFDGVGHNNGVVSGTAANIGPLGYYNDGTNAGGMCQTKSGALLGGLATSTVLAIINTTAATAAVETPETAIGSGGNAIYSERAAIGNDIYKLSLAYPSAGENASNLTVEFTYRNDGGTLLQRRMLAPNANNGADHIVALTKNGTAHRVYFNGVAGPNTTAFGSSSTAFSNAGLGCVIGNDLGGGAKAAWNGFIRLVLLYSRALSPVEIASLSANPWQAYEPEIVWVEVGGTESFTGTYAAIQAIQQQSIISALSFSGISSQIQPANTEALAAILGFSGEIGQIQAIQAQAIFQALLITGVIGQSQAAQIASLTAALSFSGTLDQSQNGQIEALASVLSFAGATQQAQEAQTEVLEGLLSFGGNVTQAQRIQIETLTAILAFSGGIEQTQEQQRQLILEFIAAIVFGFGFKLQPEVKGYILPRETRGFKLPVENRGYKV